jgi:hypothetical protein
VEPSLSQEAKAQSEALAQLSRKLQSSEALVEGWEW